MAIHIQDFAGKEQFQSILCNWAKGTGLEAMVQSVDGKTVYYADGEEREPGKTLYIADPKNSALILFSVNSSMMEKKWQAFI